MGIIQGSITAKLPERMSTEECEEQFATDKIKKAILVYTDQHGNEQQLEVNISDISINK